MLLSFFLFLLLLTGVSSPLEATQPFWSMEPSLQQIERADSLTGFDITKYVIDLSINDQTQFISGIIEAFVTAEENLSQIQYRLMGGSLAVTQVQVNGIATTFTHLDGILSIPLNITTVTQFTTKVWYSGIPSLSPAPYNIGLRFTANGCYTLSNPDAGRYWWCSYDHPWDKALVDWHITVRSDWLAAANGIRTGITDNGNGTRTHHWVSSSPIATYVIGFAAGPYTEFTQQAGDIPIQNFVLPSQLNNATVDFSNTPQMISFFSDTFGPYPFEKYGHVVVNMATYAAMEHQTMTTFGAAYIDGQQTYESIVAHELAHQWYGNYITPLTMTEVWLKESFATYSEALWVMHNEGWQAGLDYLQGSIQQYYISWENGNGPHTIFNPPYNLMFAPPTYEKSASVLHMLRLKMGNEDFFEFIRALVTNYGNSNLITTEFIDLAEQISGLDLTQFFQQWIYSPGIPNARVTVFTNSYNTAKVIARSLSPTPTQFYLDVPVSLPGSAVADSVVILASPDGHINYFSILPEDDISTLMVDPNHWLLIRQLILDRAELLSCLPYDSTVDIAWSAFASEVTVTGYHVYRRSLPDGAFQQINPQLITGLAYTDHAVVNGTGYEYYIVAVDPEGYISMPSNRITAMPIAFPFDLGFLVVDETRDGNGNIISPTDMMVDDFYASALAGFNYTQWDYASQGAPSLSTLSRYPLILWHADDFSDLQLSNNLSTLGSYVLSGGRLIISGWKYPSIFNTDFLTRFLPGITLNYNNSAVLLSAQSDEFPDLYPDPLKLASPWNGMLPMTYTFVGAQDPLYTAEIFEGGSGNGEPNAIRIENGGTIVMLGFPLYFMQADGVQGFLENLIPQLYPVALADENQIPAKPSLSCYPNPFSRDLTIKISHAGNYDLTIYNLRGQLVTPLPKESSQASEHTLHWNGNDSQGKQLPNGIYFLRLATERGSLLHKIVLMR